jgi:hypothetical protein
MPTQQIQVGVIDDAGNQCIDDFGLAVVEVATIVTVSPRPIFNPGQEWQGFTDFPRGAWR